MGDPKKQRKKYKTPAHPWQKDRILSERKLMNQYGLRNKKQLWKMSSVLKDIKTQAKVIIGQTEEESKTQKELFLNRLAKLGFIQNIDTKLEDVLGLSVKDILERRLQTIVLRKGLAKSMKQARQFIVHGQIIVGSNTVDVPSFIVPTADETTVSFNARSALADPDHPERAAKKKETPKAKTDTEKDFEEVKEAEAVTEKVEEAAKEAAEEIKVEEVVEKVEGTKEEGADKKEEVADGKKVKEVLEKLKEEPAKEKKEEPKVEKTE